jgi:hypothetical protein
MSSGAWCGGYSSELYERYTAPQVLPKLARVRIYWGLGISDDYSLCPLCLGFLLADYMGELWVKERC